MANKNRGKQTGRVVTQELPAPAGGVRLETFIPWTLVKRGVKKQVITPLDAPGAFQVEAKQERAARGAAQDNALMRALGLAHYWQRLLEDGRFGSLTEIARSEGMDLAEVSRITAFAYLSPSVVARLTMTAGSTAITRQMLCRLYSSSVWREQESAISF
ncbi:hypothetical protein ABS755_07030 [Castellaniella sp. FW104-16D08]|uniref:hypothetical protein n=1 Tax=unclassified Castellaniella TaxID=2617606 RepID=UPI003315006F